MSQKKRRLLDQSINWIRDHHLTTNLEVPEEYVLAWTYEDDAEEPKPAGFFFSVFCFGYMQHELLTGPIPPTVARSVPLSRLIDCFNRWQMKLALAEIHRRTDIQVDPMPLFGFPDSEEIKYRPRPRDSSPTLEASAPNS